VLRIPHSLDNWLTNGREVVNLKHRPRFANKKHFFISLSGSNFCYRLSKCQGLVRPEGLGNLITCNYFSSIEPATKE
jgi:hypothetical protein